MGMLRSCAAIVATTLVALMTVVPANAQPDAARRVATVVWWQGPNEITAAPAVAEVVNRRGVAWIDVSPRSVATADSRPQIQAQLARGIAAYEALQFADALVALGEAERGIDAIGAHAVDTVTLSDLFLYRALAGAQTQAATAWDDFVMAAKLGSESCTLPCIWHLGKSLSTLRLTPLTKKSDSQMMSSYAFERRWD